MNVGLKNRKLLLVRVIGRFWKTEGSWNRDSTVWLKNHPKSPLTYTWHGRLCSESIRILNYSCKTNSLSIGLQRYNFSQYDTYLNASATIRYMIRYIITYNWQVCFVHGHTRLCQLTTNWNCACFCATILKDMSPEACKAIHSNDGTFFPFPGSLCVINSSERAWPWIRSRKRQLFLTAEFFIHEESQYHNITISCHNIDICIVTKNIAILRSIGVSLQHYLSKKHLKLENILI